MKNQIDSDFGDVIDYFKNRGYLAEKLDLKYVKKIRHLHYITSTFLFLEKSFVTRNHANIFFSEIISSYIQLLPTITQGFYKLSAFLMRDILENTLKYIYYYQHPVELAWVENGDNYFLEIDLLLNYLEKYPTLSTHIKQENIKSRTKSLYQELSSYIHSKGSKHMQMIKYLKGFKVNAQEFDEFYGRITKITDITLFVIILFNWEKYVRIGIQEKRIILEAPSRKIKKYLQSI